MTLYDTPTPPRREDPAERAAIDAHIAAHGVTQCPPMAFSECTLTPRQIAQRDSWAAYITRNNKRRARK